MYTLQELKDAVVELYKNNTPIPKTKGRYTYILKVADCVKFSSQF